MKKPIKSLPFVAAIVAIIAAVAVFAMQPRRKATSPPAPPPASQFQHTVAAVGLIESSSENIRIGSHLSGIVENVLVRAGDDVKANAPLFRLDTRHLQAALADADAAFDVARAGVVVAEATLSDMKEQLALVLAVRDKRAVSEDAVPRRSHAVETGAAHVARARAAGTAAEA